jgi:hypothetical protein
MQYLRGKNYDANQTWDFPKSTEPCKVFDKEGNLIKVIEPETNRFRVKRKLDETVEEKDIVDLLIKSVKIRFEREVRCQFGRVDLLTKKLIIEAKEVTHYKHGVGQLLAYKEVFKSKKPLLYLFDRHQSYVEKKRYDKIFTFCRSQNVFVYVHNNQNPESFETFLDKYNLK